MMSATLSTLYRHYLLNCSYIEFIESSKSIGLVLRKLILIESETSIPRASFSEALQGRGRAAVALEGIKYNLYGDYPTLNIDLPLECLF